MSDPSDQGGDGTPAVSPPRPGSRSYPATASGWTTSPPPPNAPPLSHPSQSPPVAPGGVPGTAPGGTASSPQWGAQPPPPSEPPPAWPGQYPAGWQSSPYVQNAYGRPGGTRRKNPLAIASFVVSLLGILIGFIAPLFAIVVGFIARRQVLRSGGTQEGAGLALAGIIIGILLLAFDITVVVLAKGGFHCHITNHRMTCRF